MRSAESLKLFPSDEEKIQAIEGHFKAIVEILGMDLTDPSLVKTPHRYAKMLVNELCSGMNEENFPSITVQDNSFAYTEMLVESNIRIKSLCEHHFVPILGMCHIAYIPKDKVIGLSKLNRVAHYFARRPQVQERMTKQIKDSLVEILETEDVAVVVDALHLCVRMRGVQDDEALTRTLDLGGAFKLSPHRQEFLNSVPSLSTFRI